MKKILAQQNWKWFSVRLQYTRLQHSVEKLLRFEIAAFFPSPCRWRKKAAISKSKRFSTELRRSYIDCTLGYTANVFIVLYVLIVLIVLSLYYAWS